ncbi:hypothetical protein DL764_006407 [Monosporascus ibericus]|uniref:Uncharacterized protein n=1 Tax=Monosporascus ibericus TaxID=155417 RepID=A0A4Q4T4V8_9PEZI|nr:hypothetical protein DL764_006407 [Monosporascus ibericus]
MRDHGFPDYLTATTPRLRFACRSAKQRGPPRRHRGAGSRRLLVHKLERVAGLRTAVQHVVQHDARLAEIGHPPGQRNGRERRAAGGPYGTMPGG